MNGKETFKTAIQEQFGFNEQESEHIFKVYKNFKIAKFDNIGQFKVVHGAYWDKKPMKEATITPNQVK